MAAHPLFPAAQLEGLGKVLGHTEKGLTGSEIGILLSRLGMPDPAIGLTKWRRIFHALEQSQQEGKCGNKVLGLILEVMKPVRFHGNPESFGILRSDLNHVLSYSGLEIAETGEMKFCTAAKTISEAEARAGSLRVELQRRGVHPDVLKFCKAELLQNNYFHAVLEATKSVAQKIRDRTSLKGDGGELAEKALSLGQQAMPYLAFNTLQTESEQSEQKGMKNLTVGFFGTFRNTTAHTPKINWPIEEQDAMDLLTMASFLHRRLDAAVRTPRV
jgi:uncharacterized protein (TIGR02391 family)